MAAIDGRIRAHHLKMIGFSMEHTDFLQCQVDAIEEEIEARSASFREARELICTIPGVKKDAANEILAEIGTDMSVFHSDAPWRPGQGSRQVKAVASTLAVRPLTVPAS
jgi:transposase